MTFFWAQGPFIQAAHSKARMLPRQNFQRMSMSSLFQATVNGFYIRNRKNAITVLYLLICSFAAAVVGGGVSVSNVVVAVVLVHASVVVLVLKLIGYPCCCCFYLY